MCMVESPRSTAKCRACGTTKPRSDSDPPADEATRDAMNTLGTKAPSPAPTFSFGGQAVSGGRAFGSLPKSSSFTHSFMHSSKHSPDSSRAHSPLSTDREGRAGGDDPAPSQGDHTSPGFRSASTPASAPAAAATPTNVFGIRVKPAAGAFSFGQPKVSPSAASSVTTPSTPLARATSPFGASIKSGSGFAAASTASPFGSPVQRDGGFASSAPSGKSIVETSVNANEVFAGASAKAAGAPKPVFGAESAKAAGTLKPVFGGARARPTAEAASGGASATADAESECEGDGISADDGIRFEPVVKLTRVETPTGEEGWEELMAVPCKL
jgi:hypothetical protein